MACLSCHTVYPELTHFGRMFKINGYQLDNGKDLQVTTDDGDLMLALPTIPGIALFVQSGITELGKSLPDSQIPGASSQKSNVALPQQVSLLWGGKIAPHFGAFAQVTWDVSGNTFSIDNTDLRFANNYILPHKSKLQYGISLNNNPTIQDVWNTTPAFGFPYVLTEAQVPSLAGPQINAATAYNVAGLTAYAMWNEQLYGEFGFYHDAKTGTGNPITGFLGPLDSTTAHVLASNSPYWRVAYEYDIDAFALEVGGYGEYFKFYPGNGIALTGLTDNFMDVAEDFQIQYIGEKNLSTFKGTHVHESQHLYAAANAGASNPSNGLDFTEVDLDYYYMRKYGAAIGYIKTTGTTDALLYRAAPTTITTGTGATATTKFVGVTNSAISSPNTTAGVFELNYLPWLNVKLTLQFTRYSKFNGSGRNYDGLGRSAKDNNTTYLNMWFAL